MAIVAREKPMQYSIRAIIISTTAVALMLAFAKASPMNFLVEFVVTHALILFAPLVILVSTIMFADQRGTYLVLSSNPFYRSLKRLWLISIACVAVVWTLLIAWQGL